jgi:hypothetical protein
LTAERELARLRAAQAEVAAVEDDAEAPLDSYERATPEVLDALASEERHHVYRTIRLEVLAHPDGLLEATGDVPLGVSTLNPTGRGAKTRSAPLSSRCVWGRYG